MRLATYNIEWFDALFDAEDRLQADDAPSKRKGVSRRQQADAVAEALRQVDADAALIVEAPNQGARSGRNTVRALEGFAAAYGLRQRRALSGFASTTHQELSLLFDPERVEARHDPLGERLEPRAAAGNPLTPHDPARWGRPFPGAPRFDGACMWEPAPGAPLEPILFSRPPLEAALLWRPSGHRLRLIGFHLKSLRPRPGQTAEEVRRKHLGQCVWLRARIDEHISEEDPLIALGDLNQRLSTPGMDEAAFGPARFGERGRTTLMEPPPGLGRERRLWCGVEDGRDASPTVAWSAPDGSAGAARVDEILVSSPLWPMRPSWRTWSPWSPDPSWGAEGPALVQALFRASDHAPVSLDLAI